MTPLSRFETRDRWRQFVNSGGRIAAPNKLCEGAGFGDGKFELSGWYVGQISVLQVFEVERC